MKRRFGKRALALSLFLVCLSAAGLAWAALQDADIIFLTVDDSYTAGLLGTIELANPDVITGNVVTGLAGDEAGYVVDIWGQKKILLRRYNWGTDSDTVRLYPGESWSPVAESKLGDNIHQAKVVGDSLYVANWGDTGSRRGSLERYDVQDLLDNVGAMTATGKITFDDGDDFFEHVKDFRVVGNYLYAVVADVQGSWPPIYDESRLYKIALHDMTVTDNLMIGKKPGGALNKAVMAHHGNALYVVSFGGAFGETLAPSLVKVDLAAFSATPIDDGTALPEGYGYSGIAVSPDGSVLINAASTNWEEPTKLFRSTVAGLESTAELEELNLSDVGFGGTLFFDEATDRFWVEGSNLIVAIGRDGSVMRTYTAQDLGGNPYDILPAAGLSFAGEVLPPGGSSGGGCAVGSVPAGLLLLLPLLMLAGGR